MKIYVMGDVHGEFGILNKFINKKNPDIILQCGDFGYFPRHNNLQTLKNKNTKIYFCDGNHEDFESLISHSTGEVYKNCFWMKRGTTFDLPDGRVVLFFGGASSIDKEQREIGFDWFPQEDITYSEINALDPNLKVDIVISHTCPNEFDICLNEYVVENDINRKCLSHILKTYNPKFWYFGHWHKYRQGIFNDCRWYALNYSLSGDIWYMDLV